MSGYIEDSLDISYFYYVSSIHHGDSVAHLSYNSKIVGDEQDRGSKPLFNLSHLGCTIPPNVDTYWVGAAGPGPSYIEAGGGKHLYTNKTLRFMVDNLVYFAKILKDNPIPINLNELIKKAKQESN